MRLRCVSLLAFLLLSSITFGQEQTQEKTFEDGGVVFHYKPTLIYDFKPEMGYAREPVLARMPDGDLTCLHYTGGPKEPAPDNLVMITRSSDNGQSWSKPETLFEHPHRPVWGTEIFTGGEKPIAFIHTFHPATYYAEIQSFMTTTGDNGKTWSEPATIPGNGKNVSVRKGIVLESGDWVFPVYWIEAMGRWGWKTEGEPNPPFKPQIKGASGVLISSDQGKTFSIHGYVRTPDHWVWEPNIVEVAPNHLIMLGRCCQRLARSESRDGGRTWSETVLSDLPNPQSKIDFSIVEGRVVLIFNTDQRYRNRLELWVSDDGCKTWKKKVRLAESKRNSTQICYPHSLRDDQNQELLIACENGKKHWLLRVPYADFLD